MLMQGLNEHYGLGKNVVLEYVGENHIAIIKFVKRRLIERDAEGFVEVAKKIKEVDADMKVSLMCTDNICSKSLKLLADNGIDVLIGQPEAD